LTNAVKIIVGQLLHIYPRIPYFKHWRNVGGLQEGKKFRPYPELPSFVENLATINNNIIPKKCLWHMHRHLYIYRVNRFVNVHPQEKYWVNLTKSNMAFYNLFSSGINSFGDMTVQLKSQNTKMVVSAQPILHFRLSLGFITQVNEGSFFIYENRLFLTTLITPEMK
jgi:hypothetical protein